MGAFSYHYRRVMGKMFPNSYSLQQNIDDKKLCCYFVMFPSELKYYSKINGIPIFLDVWSEQAINTIIKKTENLQLYYVTSLDVFKKIKEKKPNGGVYYMPLSVSDKYFSPNFEKYKDKKYDVIQLGRRNSVLHDFMLTYVSENPHIEYIYSEAGNNTGGLEYISTKRGGIGCLDTRGKFIRTLACSKVSLVSSPMIDNDKKTQFGVDFPTPRFYESAVLGCAMVGRYTLNEEMKKQNILKVCNNIQTYQQFKETLDRALKVKRTELYETYKDFILNNLTSVRAKQIRCDLEQKNF
ncbi:MAG: hypothetical protein NC313_13460 [Butyrivibrio sp.]|nr:hypothetical protein [Butyrivibrio sp.]